MTSAQVVTLLVTNNNTPSQDSTHPEDQISLNLEDWRMLFLRPVAQGQKFCKDPWKLWKTWILIQFLIFLSNIVSGVKFGKLQSGEKRDRKFIVYLTTMEIGLRILQSYLDVFEFKFSSPTEQWMKNVLWKVQLTWVRIYILLIFTISWKVFI